SLALIPQCPSSGVTLTVEPSQEVPEGTRATMSCSATAWGDKGVNYTWYRDGRWLWEGPSGSFVLSPVSSSDAGSYQCQASGTWGTATSVPLSLSVLCECPQRHQACPKPLSHVSPPQGKGSFLLFLFLPCSSPFGVFLRQIWGHKCSRAEEFSGWAWNEGLGNMGGHQGGDGWGGDEPGWRRDELGSSW
uniref:Ig-like domain-containing protein n=1 Tax=Serinus canaria TaxID=9135 RepID=A0A8C9UAL3_SERCA